MRWFSKILIFLFFLVAVGETRAQETTPTQEENQDDYLEQTRQLVSNRVLRLSDSIDSLFGNPSYDDRNNTSTLHVKQTFYTKDGTFGSDDISATLNLYLPNFKKMEKRVTDSLFHTASPEDNTAVDKDEFNEISSWDLNQESGVAIANPINYFFRVRARRDFLTDRFVHSFFEQVGWSQNNEWEEKTSLTSDHALNRFLLFRFINEKDWQMTNKIVGTTHGPSLIYQISDAEGISYDFRYNTLIDWGGPYTNRLSLGSTYRMKTSLKWIFMSLNPELAWERDTNFRPLYNLYLSFEFVFGNKI